MEKIYDFIDRIKEKPCCLLGTRDIYRLGWVILGYEVATDECFGTFSGFSGWFQKFCMCKIGRAKNGMEWQEILVKRYTYEVAFDKFFEHLEEFKAWMEIPEQQRLEEFDQSLMRNIKTSST